MGTIVEALSELLNFPETIDKFIHSSSRQTGDGNHRRGVGGPTIPVDILDTPKEYIFYLDVPGISKSDILVTLEEDSTLVIKSNGKRKREEVGEEESRYVRLERRIPQNVIRKFKLPENCNLSAISAKCENGVLKVVVEKQPPPPPPPPPKTVEVNIS